MTVTTRDNEDLEAWLDRLIDFLSRHPEFEGQPYGKAIAEAMAKEDQQRTAARRADLAAQAQEDGDE